MDIGPLELGKENYASLICMYIMIKHRKSVHNCLFHFAFIIAMRYICTYEYLLEGG